MKVKDKRTMQNFAMKVYSKIHVKREYKLYLLQREFHILKMLRGSEHFFVRLVDVFQDSKNIYFIRTLTTNGNLLHQINNLGSFQEDAAKFYTAEILCGLEHLHGLGIVHRNLKPGNILLDEKMHIRISDFGYARKDDDDSHHRNILVGTYMYMSPEMLQQRISSKMSDLWALGCILYQMVSGVTAFHSQKHYDIFQQIVNAQYDMPEDLSEESTALIKQLLVLEASERLGARDECGYPSIRAHSFFEGVNFETLHLQTPPMIRQCFPGMSKNTVGQQMEEVVDEPIEVVSDEQMEKPIMRPDEITLRWGNSDEFNTDYYHPDSCNNLHDMTSEMFHAHLKMQEDNCVWQRFIENAVILKSGFICMEDESSFNESVMLLLTTGPHLCYVVLKTQELKEIPFHPDLKTDLRNRNFFAVHTVIISTEESF